jgi:hypothetical protein
MLKSLFSLPASFRAKTVNWFDEERKFETLLSTFSLFNQRTKLGHKTLYLMASVCTLTDETKGINEYMKIKFGWGF